MSKELLQKCYTELHKLNGLVVKSENVDCRFDDLLNEISIELLKESKTIDDYFREWESCINKLDANTSKLTEIKKEYNEKEFFILTTFDFKEKYGKDNDKIRNAHIKLELKDLENNKTELELENGRLQRKIEYIKSLMSMQKSLIDCGVLE